jgi:hypothetical protein
MSCRYVWIRHVHWFLDSIKAGNQTSADTGTTTAIHVRPTTTAGWAQHTVCCASRPENSCRHCRGRTTHDLLSLLATCLCFAPMYRNRSSKHDSCCTMTTSSYLQAMTCAMPVLRSPMIVITSVA